MTRKVPVRSFDEIGFRLRQEAANAYFAAFPPRLPERALDAGRRPFPALPDPAGIAGRLRNTCFAGQCLQIAEQVLEHRFPLLGVTLDTGPEIRWRRDYAKGIETGTAYFRRVPYLDAVQAGDHKVIWEINRHQHLVLLAQAYLFSGRPEFLKEIVDELEDWPAQNPFQRGINWTSALEVAFRGLSWIWIDHLVGSRFETDFRRRFLEGLYRHGVHLKANLSYYFSPNTHLLGEAVALHALGCLFPDFPQSSEWLETGSRVVRNELDRQVLADGCHFEQSAYYHVYALDMFLFHAVLRGVDELYADKLTRMACFLDAVLGSSGILPMLGDDDGGRFFHPFGARDRFGLATLATCGALLGRREWIRNPRYLEEQAAWWLDAGRIDAVRGGSRPVQHVSQRFADSGLVVMAAGDAQIIVDTGPFGPGRAGHTHADTLSLLVRRGEEQVLIDPGTYTYVADPVWRDRFRGTAAHNTIRIDGLDQADPGGPFAWQSRPEVEVLEWKSSPEMDVLTAVCSYRGLQHRRTVAFSKSALWIVVLDRVEGAPGVHRIEQFWHFGTAVRQLSACCFQAGEKALVAFETGTARLFEGGDYGWTSPALGRKLSAPVICVEQQATLPASLATLIDLSGKGQILRIEGRPDGRGIICTQKDGEPVTLAW